MIGTALGLNTLGAAGGGLGYLNVGAPSIGVEFDTFFNSGLGDPNGNHIQLVGNLGLGTEFLASNGGIPPLENDLEHNAMLVFNSNSGSMEVFLNGDSVLVSTYSSGMIPGTGFFGFTGGTGAARNLQYIDNVRINVPEPGTLALFGLGLAGLGFARRKKA